jgi:hypothetical protein
MNSSIEDSYVETKLKLIKLAVEASKSITTFALLEEIVDLQGQFCFTEMELQRYNNDILILKCQLLYKKITEHTADLVDYNITDRKLMQLQQTIDDFQLISTQCTSSAQDKHPVDMGIH